MNFLKKLYTYQKERFPVLTFSLYIFCIAFATFCITNYWGNINYNNPIEKLKRFYYGVRTEPYVIDYYRLIPMFIVAFLQFLMIRIVDEFKDYEEDCKYRPYRPVPRGLITLKELKKLFIICAIIQFVITYIFEPRAIFPLLIVWIFFAIMSKGFFIKKFLDKHILLEVALDELLMPILAWYLSYFASYTIPINIINSYVNYLDIGIFLLMTYIVSWIVEVARKIRSQEDEEEGVKTYTAVFGIGGAISILFILETLLILIQAFILREQYLVIIVAIYILINIINLLFVKKKNKKMAKLVVLFSNIYIVIAYLSLGLLIF